jgi:hypothetical protein
VSRDTLLNFGELAKLAGVRGEGSVSIYGLRSCWGEVLCRSFGALFWWRSIEEWQQRYCHWDSSIGVVVREATILSGSGLRSGVGL